MNCEVVQRHLLSCESPDRPSADASAHLADCAACREWLTRLVQMERAVPYLPVPPAEAARSALVCRILAQKTSNGRGTSDRRRPSVAMVLGSWIMDPHASPRRRTAAGLVAGVAAALLLFVIGWLVWYGGGTPESVVSSRPPDQLLAELGRSGIHTADGKTGSQRLQALAAAAEQLHAKCQDAARSGAYEELKAMAHLYGRVVDEGIVKTAEELSPAERSAILRSIAKDLGDADSKWRGLATAAALPDSAKLALNRAAQTATKAHDRLLELAG